MKLSKVLLILGMLSCLSLHAFAHSVTTASTVSSAAAGTSKEQVTIYEPSTDAYWDAVGGEAFHFTGVTRTYYIAADEVVWDYAPDQINLLTGQPFTPAEAATTVSGPNRIGSKYMKCMYQEYTDSKFTQLKPRTADDAHLGFFSPVIRAEVGDIIKVVFQNNCKFTTTMHPHGVFNNKANEGAPYNDGTSGKNKLDDAVAPGGRYTYTWPVPERCGPGPMDGSSVMWMYHGHYDEVVDFYAGLIGPMAITRKGYARPDATPKDVDRELFIMYSVANENTSPYLAYNYATFTTPPAGPNAPVPTDGGFTGSNNKDAINGYLYGNGPMIVLKKGEHVRWYVMSMGGFGDGHAPAWHGNVVLVNGNRQAMVSVEPGEMVTADMCPDDVGIWLFHCHINDHLIAGMGTRYQVVP